MNRLFDLRFVIGAFFSIIGIILLLNSFITSSEDSQTINRWCGVAFLVFGLFMLILSFQKDASDEVLTHDNDEKN